MTPTLDPHATQPVLRGLGVNVRASVPGYPTTTPDGHRRWIVGHGEDELTIEEQDDTFVVKTSDLAEPVVIPRDEVVRAAAGVANLIAARLHDARRAYQVLDDAILPATDVEAQANTVTHAAIAIAYLETDGMGDQ